MPENYPVSRKEVERRVLGPEQSANLQVAEDLLKRRRHATRMEDMVAALWSEAGVNPKALSGSKLLSCYATDCW